MKYINTTPQNRKSLTQSNPIHPLSLGMYINGLLVAYT
jgi:hypothetical protein